MPAASPTPPGRVYRTPFGFMADAQRDLMGLLQSLAREHGLVSRIRMLPLPDTFLLVDPEHIKHVLQENNQNYWKGIPVQKIKVLVGEGLFTSEGDFWRRQRRLAQPAFHRQRIGGLAATMTEITAAMLERWERHPKGEPLDLLPEMSNLTLNIVGRALFGRDLAGEAAAVGEALPIALEHMTYRLTRFLFWPVFVPTPRNWSFWKARRELDRVVHAIIEERRRDGADRGDLLSMLMQIRDEETGEGMSDRQLRDEVMTFVLAGHETTAVTLAWLWAELGRNREAEEQLRAEIAAALGGRVPTLEDLPGLAAVRRCVEETLRLYPPVLTLTRQAYADDEIAGYRIPKNTVLMLSPLITQQRPEWWEDPQRFDPDRFRPERAAGRPRYAYFPFGGGPRQCIGNEFALMEATLIAAMVLQRFRMTPDPSCRIEPEVRLTLRPKNGVRVRLTPA